MAKFTAEQKEKMCIQVLDGSLTLVQAGRVFHTDPKHLGKMVRYYRALGPGCFHKGKNAHYSAQFKNKVIMEYLQGGISLDKLDIRYRLPVYTAKRWFREYSRGKVLKDSPRSDRHLRETHPSVYNEENERRMEERMARYSKEEKIRLIKACISSGQSIREFCRENGLKYTTFYQWMRKYKLKGPKGLDDGRGRPADPAQLDELERLTRENRRLKEQLRQQELITELIKKKNSYDPFR